MPAKLRSWIYEARATDLLNGAKHGVGQHRMAYDENLADRVRNVISEREGMREKKMFGGLAFMFRGNMCCGVVGDDLMVRVGSKGHEEALSHPHTRQMDFTGKPMKGMIYVGADGLSAQEDLEAWVMKGVEYAGSLPAK